MQSGEHGEERGVRQDDRNVRRCALQCLYQFDAGINERPDGMWRSLVGDEASPGDESRERGYDLACLAWEFRAEADAAIAPLTPEWPSHRQPMVDRNVLRLAFYEVVHADVPPKVSINESIELAREFGGERSPAFVNGVLDRLFRDKLAAESGHPSDTPAAPSV